MSSQSFQHPASYRDPSGFIFTSNGEIYRQVNKVYQENFELLMSSGLYQSLVSKGLLVSHETALAVPVQNDDCYSVIKPEIVKYISYPYEWSFDMLKDAALLTLGVMREALRFDMIVKDATPYNIQWHNGKFIFIDTLSFEKYIPAPWQAYRQFCENFLGPLLLMHYRKMSLQQFQLAFPEGIPLSVIKKLLPWRSRFSIRTYLHIYLHARVSTHKTDNTRKPVFFSKKKLIDLISSLEELIVQLKPTIAKTTWSGYYEEVAGRKEYLPEKKKIISAWFDQLDDVRTMMDIGTNSGEFSILAAKKFERIVSTDFDPLCINELYKTLKKAEYKNIQPLIIDIANPSPSAGFNNKERQSFIERSSNDLVMVLAFIHHLAIGKNIPLRLIADFFKQIGEKLIIEFVPKDDEKVQEMLSRKKDIYRHYTEAEFIECFEKYYSILDRKSIPGSKRILFLLKRKGTNT